MTRRPSRLALAAALILPLLVPAASAAAADIVPHTAAYDLVLQSLRMEQKAAGSEGRMFLRLERICEGWRISTQLDFRARFAGGDALRIDITNSIDETEAGDLLAFETRSRFNGKVQSETRGAARIAAGSDGRAVFTVPSRREVALPAGTMFPASGARHLIDLLLSGRTGVTRRIFDGSTSAVFDVADEVARGRLAPGDPPQGDGALLAAPSWRLVSVWTLEGGRKTVQKTDLQLHANGVASRMIVDLGIMVLDARLAEIRRLPPPDC